MTFLERWSRGVWLHSDLDQEGGMQRQATLADSLTASHQPQSNGAAALFLLWTNSSNLIFYHDQFTHHLELDVSVSAQLAVKSIDSPVR